MVKIKSDCVFKSSENGKIKKNCPKLIKWCLLCSTYIPNKGNIENDFKYFDFAIRLRQSRYTLFISILSLLISITALVITIFKFLIGLKDQP